MKDMRHQPTNSPGGRGHFVQIRSDIAKKIRVIAAAFNMSVPQYVNSRLAPIAEADLPGVLEAMAQK